METILDSLGLTGELSGAGGGSWYDCRGEVLESISPIDGKVIGKIRCADRADYERVASQAVEAFRVWRMVPAPKRGEIVRQLGNALRTRRAELGGLVTLEMGKIKAEGEGEVQEMIDISDLAVGQSRMLYGLTMHSERAGHRMYEQWHPLGPIGVITTFNFPVAVWAWNAMLALVAGDPVIWKPSSKTPLSAIAVMKVAWQVLKENDVPEGLLGLVIGKHDEVGEALIRDRRIPLVSATGSVPMGRHVSQVVAERMGRTILELSGNNAVIVAPSADLDLAIRAILFAAVGTAGQRCTTTRRVIAHKALYEALRERLIMAYEQVRIGNPLEDGILMGPLIDRDAVTSMARALKEMESQGGRVLYGGEILTGGLFDSGTYVRPCICEVKPDMPLLQKETFAPILYLMPYETLEEAIQYQNSVSQGLSSAIFTNDLRETEMFLSHMGSDCGIANVNMGTSGAEIGGAFGGEKETGGGREAGSDVWKTYMRRQTCTVNWSTELPLSQGIRFEV
ncbi:MAG: aldehyde dehydrogenase family protein [Deltaproteobacteria bacterium HGW-Deltaproteobacteria-21]|nr:MAG: aldehyde dehydrogenase family protein [Deltaproteobacteria bacterium HGW-Deltaproteobacteria-21]